MALCEMCGKEDKVVTAEVEAVEMKLCQPCSKYGTVKRKSVLSRSFRPSQVINSKPEFKVVNNFSSIIAQSRASSGMKQEDFAKMLNERESVVAKWESGSLRPRIDVARKVGRILKVNLVQRIVADETVDIAKKASDEFTLGDFIKKRRG